MDEPRTGQAIFLLALVDMKKGRVMKPSRAVLIPCLCLMASCASPSLPSGTVSPTALLAPPAPVGGALEVGRPAEPLAKQQVAENETFITVDGTPQYKIGPGDVLEIVLPQGAPQEKISVPVKRNGAVVIAGVAVKVAGLTVEQAEGRLREALAPFYVNPQVDVLVKEHASKKVTVLGAVVSRGGAFPLSGRTTVTDALVKAGGPAPNADLESVRVTQPDGEIRTVNLLQLVLQGRLKQEPVLDAGSVVFVPEKPSEVPKRVFILGEVRSPGGQPYAPNLTMAQALGQAGGPTDFAVSSSARVIRGDPKNPVLIAADFDRILKDGDFRFDVPLQPGDIIYVPRSPIGDWNAFMAKLRPTMDFLNVGASTAIQYKQLITPP